MDVNSLSRSYKPIHAQTFPAGTETEFKHTARQYVSNIIHSGMYYFLSIVYILFWTALEYWRLHQGF